jgi:hypothetical protein
LDSGAVIQLPTSIIRAYFRYNNAFVQPQVNGTAFGVFPALPAVSAPQPPNPEPLPLAVKAFAAYFGRIHNKLYKTQYLYAGKSIVNPVPFSTFDGTNYNGVLYCIPPFAKSVRLIRVPTSASMTVELWNQTNAGGRVDASYVIASGALSPIMPIEGNMNLISIKSTTQNAGDEVSGVRLVYEIAF